MGAAAIHTGATNQYSRMSTAQLAAALLAARTRPAATLRGDLQPAPLLSRWKEVKGKRKHRRMWVLEEIELLEEKRVSILPTIS